MVFGQMTVRSTPEGDLSHNDIYCAVLEVIFDKIQSGSLGDVIDGIAVTQYIPNPLGTDTKCDLRASAISITSDGDNDSSTRGTSSNGAVVAGSAAAGAFALALAFLFARKRSRGDTDTTTVNVAETSVQSMD